MPYQTPPWTQVVAHRGNSGPLPENTRLAIESAIKAGVDMVEVDIRVTKDGVPVLMHSAAVDRTTSGAGLVEELTWNEIRGLDAGSWRGPRFAGERVISLSEVLELCRGRVALNLDLKTPAAVIPVAAAAIEAGVTDDVVITGCGEECVHTVPSITASITTLFNPMSCSRGSSLRKRATLLATASISPRSSVPSVSTSTRRSWTPISSPGLTRSVSACGRTRSTMSPVFGELIDMGASLTTNWPTHTLEVVRERSR